MPKTEGATHLEGSVPLQACERLVVALDGQGLLKTALTYWLLGLRGGPWGRLGNYFLFKISYSLLAGEAVGVGPCCLLNPRIPLLVLSFQPLSALHFGTGSVLASTS